MYDYGYRDEADNELCQIRHEVLDSVREEHEIMSQHPGDDDVYYEEGK